MGTGDPVGAESVSVLSRSFRSKIVGRGAGSSHLKTARDVIIYIQSKLIKNRKTKKAF